MCSNAYLQKFFLPCGFIKNPPSCRNPWLWADEGGSNSRGKYLMFSLANSNINLQQLLSFFFLPTTRWFYNHIILQPNYSSFFLCSFIYNFWKTIMSVLKEFIYCFCFCFVFCTVTSQRPCMGVIKGADTSCRQGVGGPKTDCIAMYTPSF